MTDRVISLTVHIKPTREDDDVHPLMDAIQQMRGVIAVVKGVVADSDYHMGRVQADMAWRNYLCAIIGDNTKPRMEDD